MWVERSERRQQRGEVREGDFNGGRTERAVREIGGREQLGSRDLWRLERGSRTKRVTDQMSGK